MESDPIVIQAAIAIPITLGLVIYTLVRWERAALHGLLAILLTSVSVWLAGSALKVAGGEEWLRVAGLHTEYVGVILMSPLFLITMGYFARSALFEQGWAASIGLLSVSGVFLLAYATDGQHHLFFTDREAAIAGAPPTVWAGPIFWALQIWVATADLVAFGYCGAVLVRGPTSAERGRAAMIFSAVLIPTLAHVVYMTKLLPIDYSLAPSTLALTAIFFVQGVHRYGLLGGQTLVRHDLIEHLDTGIVLANEGGVVLDANAAAEATLGISRADMRGLPLPEVLAMLGAVDPSEQLAERIVALPLDGSRTRGEIRTRDGRWIDVSAGAVPALASQPGGRFVSLDDRSAQRLNERLLRERQKLESVGILAAGVAHEVNNPLAYVRANLAHLEQATTELAKRDDLVDREAVGEMPDILSESIEGLDRIARIVESMLRFSRVPEEEHRPANLLEIVDEAIRLADLRRGSSIRVKRSGEALPLVLASPERLIQVLLNLFLNAKQALADQSDGVIEAETHRDGDHVVVSIRDNGPGIPLEHQERVFDPFFTTRGPDVGTGLGLSIAFDIVREHRGVLSLESEPGAGCCFSMRLPATSSHDDPLPS